jgi:hypothetical protein
LARPMIVLVSCSGPKLSHAAPARDLYTSELFRKASAFGERYCNGWAVLSAKYGLVLPDEVIAPYDVQLGQLTADERAVWGRNVRLELLNRFGNTATYNYCVLAGERYAAELRCLEPWEPLRGMQIGERLAWLKARLAQIVGDEVMQGGVR